jgi:hypothetical protein
MIHENSFKLNIINIILEGKIRVLDIRLEYLAYVI